MRQRFIIMAGVKYCFNASMGNNSITAVLIERVLPYLLSGVLFGGVPPYTIIVSDLITMDLKQGMCISDFLN